MIKVSNKSLSQKDWTVFFRVGPAWEKVLVNYGLFLSNVQKGDPTKFPTCCLWEFRVGVIRIKKDANLTFDRILLEQPENLEGFMLYKIFKFI